MNPERIPISPIGEWLVLEPQAVSTRISTKKVIREIAVNWIGYKLGIRKLLGRSRNNNVHRDVDFDVREKGIMRRDFIKDSLRQLLGEGFPSYWPPRRVLEIGPGGTLLLGLHLLAEGVAEYIGVDRFPSQMFGKYPKRCYQHALDSLPDAERLANLLKQSEAGNGPLYYFGSESAAAFENIEPGSVDLIFSWGALEHIEDVAEVFRKTRPLLSSHGVALHTISTNGHGWLTPIFLTIPDWLWWLMYWRRGFLNRYLPSDYLRWAKDAGFEAIEIDRIVAHSKYLQIKPRMLPRYQAASDEDLLTAELMLALR
jgi:hypothetical protein